MWFVASQLLVGVLDELWFKNVVSHFFYFDNLYYYGGWIFG